MNEITDTKISIPIDLAILSAARAVGQTICPPDPISRFFVNNNVYYSILPIFDYLGIPLCRLIAQRSYLIYSKLIEVLSSPLPPDILIHISGGSSTHFLHLIASELSQHRKSSRKYILTDLAPVTRVHQQKTAQFFRKCNLSSPPISYITYNVFKDNLVEKLIGANVDFENQRVLILMEGFLYYLSPNVRSKLLKQIREILYPQRGFLLTDLQINDFTSLLSNRNLNGWCQTRNICITKIMKAILSPTTYPLDKEYFETWMSVNCFQVVDYFSMISKELTSMPHLFIPNIVLKNFEPFSFMVYLFKMNCPHAIE